MNHPLKNKCALITGGSRGIGAAIVKRLASEGANVALTYSNSPDKASEVVKAAQKLGVPRHSSRQRRCRRGHGRRGTHSS